MAELKKITPERDNIQILKGDNIILEEYPLASNSHFILNNTTYTIDAYKLLGVRFPILERGEAHSLQSLSNLRDLITGIGEIKIQTLGDKRQTTDNIQVKIRKSYTWVSGKIQIPDLDSEYVEKGTYTLSEPSDVDKAIYVFIHPDKGKRAYRLTINNEPDPNDPLNEITKWTAIDITDEIDESIQSKITPENTRKNANEAHAADLNRARIEEIYLNRPPITEEITQSIRVDVHLCFMYHGSSFPSDLYGKTGDLYDLLNFHILNNGVGYFKANDAGIVEQTGGATAFKARRIEFINNASTKLLDNDDPIDNQLGLWSEQYWKDVRNNYIKDIQSISWTSLKTYHLCKYRFFMTKYRHPVSDTNQHASDEDKDGNLVWGSNKYAIRGTIIHRHAEVLLKNIVESVGGPLGDAQLKLLQTNARNHMNGTNLNNYGNYSFTKADIQAIDIEPADYEIIDATLKNINERKNDTNSNSFYADLEEVATEVPLGSETIENSSHLLIDGKKIKVVGQVDVVYKKDDGSVGIYDVKSNKKPYDYEQAAGDAYDFEILQPVWYLKFLRQRGIFKHQGIQFDFTETTLPDSKINLFFDFARYPGYGVGASGPNFDVSNGRLKIKSSDIPELTARLDGILTNMVSDIEKFQSDPDQNPVRVFPATPTNTACAFCPIKANCPHPALEESHESILRDNLLTSKIPGPLIASRKIRSALDEDEDYVVKNEEQYRKVAIGDKSSESSPSLKLAHELRRRRIGDIDDKYQTQIGAIYLTAPIISIQMIDSKRHEVRNTLRTPSPIVFRMEGTEKTVAMTIRFDSAARINSEMRHIIAQFHAFPFVSIRNPDLTRTFIPFETHKDIFYSMGSEIQSLVKMYFDVRGSGGKDRPDDKLSFDRDPAKIKQKIYERTRLYYAVKNMALSPVPNQVDTIDLTVSLQLHDTYVTTTAGDVKYLYDSNSVMNQLSWLYNQNYDGNTDSKIKTSLVNAFAGNLGGTASAFGDLVSPSQFNIIRVYPFEPGSSSSSRYSVGSPIYNGINIKVPIVNNTNSAYVLNPQYKHDRFQLRFRAPGNGDEVEYAKYEPKDEAYAAPGTYATRVILHKDIDSHLINVNKRYKHDFNGAFGVYMTDALLTQFVIYNKNAFSQLYRSSHDQQNKAKWDIFGGGSDILQPIEGSPFYGSSPNSKTIAKLNTIKNANNDEDLSIVDSFLTNDILVQISKDENNSSTNENWGIPSSVYYGSVGRVFGLRLTEGQNAAWSVNGHLCRPSINWYFGRHGAYSTFHVASPLHSTYTATQSENSILFSGVTATVLKENFGKNRKSNISTLDPNVIPDSTLNTGKKRSAYRIRAMHGENRIRHSNQKYVSNKASHDDEVHVIDSISIQNESTTRIPYKISTREIVPAGISSYMRIVKINIEVIDNKYVIHGPGSFSYTETDNKLVIRDSTLIENPQNIDIFIATLNITGSSSGIGSDIYFSFPIVSNEISNKYNNSSKTKYWFHGVTSDAASKYAEYIRRNEYYTTIRDEISRKGSSEDDIHPDLAIRSVIKYLS